MSRAPLIALEQPEEGIALLRMQDAEAKNCFHPEFIDQLLDALDRVGKNPETRVCLVCGLPGVFCGGAGEELLRELAGGEMEASDIVLPKVMLDVPVPTIAVMEGHAVGGGLALGLCCDLVLMANESRYGCSFMNMGFTPGMGTTGLLQLAVGEYMANEMMYGGQFFKGSHFAGRGSINYVLSRAKLMRKATGLARRIAEKPRFALEQLKRTLSLPRRQAFEQTLTVESLMHRICFAHPETRARIADNYAGSQKEGPKNE